MQFSDEQMAALDARAETEFVERLAVYLRERQTLWVRNLSDDKLRERVHSGIARARSHGFTWSSSLAKYVGLMFRYAPNFDEFPPMREVLARQDVPAEQRSDLLFETLTEAQWEAAAERYDPAAWDDFA